METAVVPRTHRHGFHQRSPASIRSGSRLPGGGSGQVANGENTHGGL
jgi:hypothetical protein